MGPTLARLEVAPAWEPTPAKVCSRQLSSHAGVPSFTLAWEILAGEGRPSPARDPRQRDPGLASVRKSRWRDLDLRWRESLAGVRSGHAGVDFLVSVGSSLADKGKGSP